MHRQINQLNIGKIVYYSTATAGKGQTTASAIKRKLQQNKTLKTVIQTSEIGTTTTKHIGISDRKD